MSLIGSLRLTIIDTVLHLEDPHKCAFASLTIIDTMLHLEDLHKCAFASLIYVEDYSR